MLKEYLHDVILILLDLTTAVFWLRNLNGVCLGDMSAATAVRARNLVLLLLIVLLKSARINSRKQDLVARPLATPKGWRPLATNWRAKQLLCTELFLLGFFT